MGNTTTRKTKTKVVTTELPSDRQEFLIRAGLFVGGLLTGGVGVVGWVYAVLHSAPYCGGW